MIWRLKRHALTPKVHKRAQSEKFRIWVSGGQFFGNQDLSILNSKKLPCTLALIYLRGQGARMIWKGGDRFFVDFLLVF